MRRVARTYVLAVDYTSPDRVKAAAIANAFAEAYLTDQLDAKFEATRRAAGWLQTPHRRVEAKVARLRSRHPEVQGRQGNCRHRRRQARPDLRPAADRSQRADGAWRAPTRRRRRRVIEQIEDLLKSGRVGATVPDSLANPVITDLREKFLNASKLEAQLESKLGGGHLQVINLRQEMEEYQRLINEELQRIAESYRSEAEVAREKEQSLSLAMSGLVGASAGTNQTHGAIARIGTRIRNLPQSLSDFHAALSGGDSTAVFSGKRGAGDHRGDAASSPQVIPSAASSWRCLWSWARWSALASAHCANIATACSAPPRQVRDELGLEFLGMLQDVERAGDRQERQRTKPGSEADPCRPIRSSAIRSTIRSRSFSETLAFGQGRGGSGARRAAEPKVIGVISALPNEGKSTVAKNFASLLAHLGARAVLIDGDLRNPGLDPQHRAPGRGRAFSRRSAAIVRCAISCCRSRIPASSFCPRSSGSGCSTRAKSLSSSGMRGVLARSRQSV